MSGGAIPYFGDAYMADTRHLTLEEHGAYHLLILIAWRSPNCALPNDDKRIAQMLGITPKKWAGLRPTVLAFWTLTDNGWEQKRLTKERRWVQEKSNKNRDAANAKWNAKSLKNNKPSDANAYPNADANADANGYAPLPRPTISKKELPKGSSKKVAKPLPKDWHPEPFAEGTKSRKVLDGWWFNQHERFGYELEAFKAHHQSRANVMLDWQAAWSTWVLNSAKFDKERKNGSTANRGGKSAQAFAAVGGSDERAF